MRVPEPVIGHLETGALGQPRELLGKLPGAHRRPVDPGEQQPKVVFTETKA